MDTDTDKLIAARFDTVLYDLDGTLIDSAKDMELAVSHVLADHGLPPVSEEDVRIFMGQGSKVTMGKAFAKYGKVLDDAALSAVTREFVRYYEADPVSNTTAFAGVAEVVVGGMHRGRFNMLANVMGKPLGPMIAEIWGITPDDCTLR